MRTRAVRTLLSLIADAESLGSVEAYHAELVKVMALVLPCEVVNFNEFCLERPDGSRESPIVTCTSSPLAEPRDPVSPALLDAFLRHMTEHPLIRLHAAGDLGAYRLSDTASTRRFRDTSLYGEFFRPAALEHQLTLGLEATRHRLTGLWFNRTRRNFLRWRFAHGRAAPSTPSGGRSLGPARRGPPRADRAGARGARHHRCGSE